MLENIVSKHFKKPKQPHNEKIKAFAQFFFGWNEIVMGWRHDFKKEHHWRSSKTVVNC